uniref:Uncharacterized protein n=1 Tax=Rhizophora mucronata TaxID=61149 RepID=A0A2P2MIH9_RHIMU
MRKFSFSFLNHLFSIGEKFCNFLLNYFCFWIQVIFTLNQLNLSVPSLITKIKNSNNLITMLQLDDINESFMNENF